jgi:hypothetical protein
VGRARVGETKAVGLSKPSKGAIAISLKSMPYSHAHKNWPKKSAPHQ